MYQSQAMANQPTMQSPESALNRLQQINDILGQCEAHLYEIRTKLRGPGPVEGSSPKVDAPVSISHHLMEANARAQRMLSALNEINIELG